MPYNPGGIFSLVATYFANPGTTIRTEQHNPVFEDVASALSQVVLRDGRALMTGPLNMNGNPITGVVAGSSAGSVATLAQSVPIGGMIDFAGAVAPSGWLLCSGQSLSRTTYAALFAVIGTTYGTADASSFSLPDMRGRVSAGFDLGNVTGRLNGAYGGPNAAVLGAVGGAQSHQLTAEQIPALSSSGLTASSSSNSTVSGGVVGGTSLTTLVINPGGNTATVGGASIIVSTATTTTISGSINGGGGAVHNNVQPTFITNKIIRVSYDV